MKNCHAGVMLSNSLRAYQNFSMNENPRRGRGRFPRNFRGCGRSMPYGTHIMGIPIATTVVTEVVVRGEDWYVPGLLRQCHVPQTKTGR
ncbi:hypothetical protein DPMN_037908 [Dreissena polymorpha]|uniref:Uncharacterized protein n=1 Tax=Dreissena polymorpha TaxID=45954 RepID=A0A9D4MBT1_DREPO|nr:hypothetical protein DPMN_037908 [Dreissena polymorpha]